MSPRKGLPSHILALLKGHFFAGLLVLAPLGVIAWICVWALGALWHLHEWVPDGWKPEAFLGDSAAATALDGLLMLGTALGLALAVSALGWASKQYLGEKLLEWLGQLIHRVPVIRGVYSALQQLLGTFARGEGQQFSRVVYVEYPRKGVWAIGFVTSAARGHGIPPAHLNLYVPTTPNPTSGFHLIVPETEVRDTQMSVEDAFRTLLSLGIAQPDEIQRGGAT